jgi:hypothetical protein
MGLGGQYHSSAALPPGKTQYPLYSRLGWPEGWSGRAKNISPPHRESTVQPVASHLPTELSPTVQLLFVMFDDKRIVFGYGGV